MTQNKGYMNCPRCGGAGRITCRVCFGTGIILRQDKETTCQSCGGSGFTPCVYCTGSGYIRSKDAEIFVSVEGTNAEDVRKVASDLLAEAKTMIGRRKGQTKNVLVVFANPKGSSPLRLENEDRVMRESVKLSLDREHIGLNIIHAARVDDFARALLESDYQIVHFSGHGTGKGLAFENEIQEVQVIPKEALAETLSVYSPPIECVLLNACFSDIHAQSLSMGVPYTIVINGPISDEGATEFTRGFYDAIGAGRTVEFAYKEGCRRIRLKNLSDGSTPVLVTKSVG